jgi:hypothetical protein
MTLTTKARMFDAAWVRSEAAYWYGWHVPASEQDDSEREAWSRYYTARAAVVFAERGATPLYAPLFRCFRDARALTSR